MIMVRVGSLAPTNKDNGAPPKLPKGCNSKIVVSPKGSMRNGIIVPEKSDTIAILIECPSQAMPLSLIVTQAKIKSIAKPSEMHSNNDGKNHTVAGITETPNSGAIASIGNEKMSSMGIQPPTVCAMS